jgi:prepilin-type N-terminal cleavage/methylation domain-containing protein
LRSGERGQRGFTLVELIVVIVILGILAAIAVPALTGYIAKSEDKQWEMRARDFNVAAHAILDEAYAKGELSSTAIQTYLQTGDDHVSENARVISAIGLGWRYNGDSSYYLRQISALAGEEFRMVDAWMPYSHLAFVLPPGETTAAAALGADGFYWWYFPGEKADGQPVIYVTYKVSPMPVPSNASFNDFDAPLDSIIAYDPDAGYQVYHLVYYE